MTLPKPPRPIRTLNAEELCPDSVHPLIYQDKRGVLDGYYWITYSEDRYADDVVAMSPMFIAKGTLSKGFKQGVWQTTFFLADDGLNYREFYKDGLLEGDFTVYRPDKSVCYHTVFHQGTGTWKSFYPSGQPRLSYSLVRGQLQGTRTEYAPDGSVKAEAVYDHGVVRSRKNP